MARVKILKRDVELILDCVNRNLPQQSDSIRREFKADYAHQYGGWMICYYDGSARATYSFSQYRIPHAEAYKYFPSTTKTLRSISPTTTATLTVPLERRTSTSVTMTKEKIFARRNKL